MAERRVVRAVIEELNQSIAADRGLRLEAALWETDAFPGFHAEGPQGLIDGILQIGDCDVLVGIFWKRFGTPTGDARSGTEHEFRVAHEAWTKHGRPQIMVYFNQQPYNPQSKEEIDQWGQVLEFKKSFPKEGLWWAYEGAAEFERLLRVHLTRFIRVTYPQTVGTSGPATAKPTLSPARPDYFAVQSKIIAEYTRTFVGRVRGQQAFEDFLNTHGSGYFIVRGAPGQGKTAFSCQLVKHGGYVHHFISRSGSRSDTRLILRSLLSQLLPLAGGGGLPESISELTKTFEETLAAVAAKQKRVVIVIDALDELPAEAGELPYLATDALPEGVFYVVTSRPGNLLDRLQERLFALPPQLFDLGPLDLPEISDLLRARKPDIREADLERIAEASQGNPLYLRAVADELDRTPAYDLQLLPSTVEGFFRNSTSGLRGGNLVLAEILGLLSVARTSLSMRELSEITGHSQRQVDEQGIRPIRQFLLKTDGSYSFYHARFHEFVTRNILYADEMRQSHRKIADWLERPENHRSEYRWASLTYHLFESGNRERLIQIIDQAFLIEKVQQLGYAVLEDVDLLARCLLDVGDPAAVERCVSMVEGLREVVGGDIIPDAAKAVQTYRAGPASFRTRVIEPVVPSIAGLDIYVAVLPKAEVAADFFEIVPLGDRLVVAIGDAPALGLKSAFVARFLGNLFRKMAQGSRPLRLDEVLTSLNARIQDQDYFQRVSMQCVSFEPRRGIMEIANAGHPYPVHYSARRGKCDILPVRGNLLHNPAGQAGSSDRYEKYSVETAPGDIVVLVTDGLTEGHVMLGDPYGYRFTSLVEANAMQSARTIGEAVLDGWRAHPREEDCADDVSIIVIGVRAGAKL
jgi:hypothetical protein